MPLHLHPQRINGTKIQHVRDILHSAARIIEQMYRVQKPELYDEAVRRGKLRMAQVLSQRLLAREVYLGKLGGRHRPVGRVREPLDRPPQPVGDTLLDCVPNACAGTARKGMVQDRSCRCGTVFIKIDDVAYSQLKESCDIVGRPRAKAGA